MSDRSLSPSPRTALDDTTRHSKTFGCLAFFSIEGFLTNQEIACHKSRSCAPQFSYWPTVVRLFSGLPTKTCIAHSFRIDILLLLGAQVVLVLESVSLRGTRLQCQMLNGNTERGYGEHSVCLGGPGDACTTFGNLVICFAGQPNSENSKFYCCCVHSRKLHATISEDM